MQEEEKTQMYNFLYDKYFSQCNIEASRRIDWKKE